MDETIIMEATELRIGNWVYEGKRLVHLHDGFGIDHAHNFKPIPLTEKWLIKSNAQEFSNYWVYDRFRLIWKESYNYWYIVDTHNYNYLTKIEYVHEWQNFVFAMNNQELTL